MKYFNFLVETPDEAVSRLDDIGGPNSHANYPWGWAQAGNTPFKWYKQNTHEGGVHVPLIVHWPAGVADHGGASRPVPLRQRHRPHHLRRGGRRGARGLPRPRPDAHHRPVDEGRAHGRPGRAATGEPRVQYFEMMGHRALYADGWKAVTRHPFGSSFDDDRWELYHVAEDRSECHDLAAQEPDRLAALVDRWWHEAEVHGVLPLDDRTVELFGARFREHSAHPVSRHYTYRPPLTPMPAQVGASIGGRSWDLEATITDRPGGAGGVLYATGTQNSGLSLFIADDRLVFDYNCFGDHHVVRSSVELAPGPGVVGVRFRRTGSSGTATLVVDGAGGGIDRRAVRHAHDLERRGQRGLRPRITGEHRLRRRVPVRRPARAGGHPAHLARRRRRGRGGGARRGDPASSAARRARPRSRRAGRRAS